MTCVCVHLRVRSLIAMLSLVHTLRGVQTPTLVGARQDTCYLQEISSELLALILSRSSLQQILALRATSSRLLGCTEVVQTLSFEQLAYPMSITNMAAVLAAFPQLTSLRMARNVLRGGRIPADTTIASRPSADDAEREYVLPPVPSPQLISDELASSAPASTAEQAASSRPKRKRSAYAEVPAKRSAAPPAVQTATGDRPSSGVRDSRADVAHAGQSNCAASTRRISTRSSSPPAPPPANPSSSDGPEQPLVASATGSSGMLTAPVDDLTPDLSLDTLGGLLASKVHRLHTLAAPGNSIYAYGAEQLVRGMLRVTQHHATDETIGALDGDIDDTSLASGAPPSLTSTASILPLAILNLSDAKLSLDWQGGCLAHRPEPICKLLRSLGRAPLLTHLYLPGNSMCAIAAQALAAWLSRPGGTLETLDLSRNSLGDVGGVVLARALRTNTRLQALSLDEFMLTDATAKKFQKTLRLNSALRALSLSWNGIEVAGAIDLCKSFLDNGKTPLRSLDLSCNAFALFGGTTHKQAMTLVKLKDSLSLQRNLQLYLGHISGYGEA